MLQRRVPVAFLFLGAMLLVSLFVVALFVLSAGSVLQAHGQTASASVSSASGEPDLPDAPSPTPVLQQSSQSVLPFLSPPGSSRPLQSMNLEDKFKYLMEPAFGPRSLVTNAFGAGIRMANPPKDYPHE